ncbi:alpha/beta hydrolase [Streptomyces sp. CRN 30]|uniref:alpha/beta fold hydrolase n=1 Tax=Streptomyces sp. CRN 30 TaxID=3075613 RepID=UPI002A80A5BF|nr:alpha/beta hydrolase [Streptomyces sp. CRN 30]
MSPALPTAVLVHGAFTDGANWLGVIDELQRDGVSVVAVANPLRGLTADAAYVASRVAQIDGPVVLVGHAYGGAVVTVAGTARNVVALVHVAAYIPAEGETLAALRDRFPPPAPPGDLRRWTYPGGDGEAATEVSVAAEAFHATVAADVSPAVARALAATQRPLAAAALTEPVPAAAWRTRPCWALVAGADRVIHPGLVRFGAERAGAVTVELADASHAVTVSRPAAVAALILEAVHAAAAPERTRGTSRA